MSDETDKIEATIWEWITRHCSLSEDECDELASLVEDLRYSSHCDGADYARPI